MLWDTPWAPLRTKLLKANVNGIASDDDQPFLHVIISKSNIKRGTKRLRVLTMVSPLQQTVCWVQGFKKSDRIESMGLQFSPFVPLSFSQQFKLPVLHCSEPFLTAYIVSLSIIMRIRDLEQRLTMGLATAKRGRARMAIALKESIFILFENEMVW